MARRLRAGCHYYAFVVIYIVMLSAFGSFMNDMYSPALPAMCRFFGCFCSIQTSFILSEIRRAALFLIIHNFVRFFQSSAEEVKFSSGSGLGGQMPAQKEVDMD